MGKTTTKRILIDRVYTGQGIVNLPPGVYDENDERLQGQGAYFLKTRIAVPYTGPVKASKPAPVVVDDEPEVDDSDGGESEDFDDDDDDDDSDDDDEEDGAPVQLEYIGTNVRAASFKVGETVYTVPKHQDGEDGAPIRRIISVAAADAEDLLLRGAFKLAEG